jgi:hypothetical protein
VNGFASRKFVLTAGVLGASIVGLFVCRIDQQHFVWLSSLTLGMYGSAAIADQKLNGSRGA